MGVHEQRVAAELREVVNPAQTVRAASRVALERSISTHAGFLLSGDDRLRAQSERWLQQWRRALADLIRLSERLGPESRQAVARLQARDEEFWQAGPQRD